MEPSSFIPQIEASASSAASAPDPTLWAIGLVAAVAAAMAAVLILYNRKTKGK